ncbi:MAG: HAD family hydrolase [Proteobacteria bacterium]|nr:HAD family hydrolase [Pseudomonadota bacterium]
MMLDAIQAIIFDMDDTLYLERDYVRSGFYAVGEAIACPEFGAFCWARFLEGVRGNTFDLARETFPSIEQDTRTLVELYRTHIPHISLCPDALELICTTRLRTGLISDGPIQSQRSKFRALGLMPWIECPIFTQETCAPKPAPAAFQLMAYTLNTPYENCLYVGDNPKKDFAGAKEIGMKTARIRRPESLHCTVDSGKDVDWEIQSLNELHFQ